MLGTAPKPVLDHVDLNSMFQLPYQAWQPVGGLIPVLGGECALDFNRSLGGTRKDLGLLKPKAFQGGSFLGGLLDREVPLGYSSQGLPLLRFQVDGIFLSTCSGCPGLPHCCTPHGPQGQMASE